MLTVDEYGTIRRAHRDGMSIRAIARRFGHSRRKIRQVLVEPEPRPYVRRTAPAPKLGPFHATIDQILADDESAPRKQRHTAMQVFRRLVAEHGYPGKYDAVRRYIGKKRRSERPTFIPLSHAAGARMEADFGHIHVDFPEERRQVPVLVLTWSYSNAPFMLALPTERVESILTGMAAGFAFFGAVPREVWWDNPKTVVTEILRGRQRRMHERYAAFANHYCFDPRFCMPASGWEKPRVEHRVYDLQRRFATPVPKVADLDDLNAHLAACCLAERERSVSGQSESIDVRLQRDVIAARALPRFAFDACVTATAVVDHYQRVQYDRSRYSVPRHARSSVTVKAYPGEVKIVSGAEVVATHRRRYDGGDQLDPRHYLVTLERRPGALDHSDVFRGWKLPPTFDALRTQLEAAHGDRTGVREYIRVLQLLAEHPVERVVRAIEMAPAGERPGAARIERRVVMLADQAHGNTGIVADSAEHIPGNLAGVEVPAPDLGKYDRHLHSSLTGELTHV